ncbi:MAG: type II toxin-antitoxin system VapC family toxin [Deltaproteobacteria bacterium]|nr:type II toxin-antitoxin system VapC family toxin [Deltaproteobacteria bacterium]
MIGNFEKIYVDTSAFYALLDRADPYHKEASSLWVSLMDNNFTLVTSNYVVSETMKLLHKRIGFEAARLWHRDILSVLEVLWVDEGIHQQAYELWLKLGRSLLSLVDCASFVTMHHHQIERAFCFKSHFADYGFEILTVSFSIDK